MDSFLPMTGTRERRWPHSLIAILFLLCTPLCLSADEDVVVITHPSNTIQTLSFKELRAIYTMHQQTWPDDSVLTIYILQEIDPLHRTFCKDILKTLPRYLRKNWDRQVFSGKGLAPTVIYSANAMKQIVANTPGAIGYLQKQQIDDSIKVISITR